MTTINQEFTSPVAPGRLFKALVLDSHKLFPKLMPQFIQSIDIMEGDGGAAGSIEQVNFTESFPYKYAKHRINELDRETLTCKYAMIEGDPLGNKLELIEYEVSGAGGCICKMRSEYHALNGHEMEEEEIMSGKESALEIFKAVEAYLLENPLVYA